MVVPGVHAQHYSIGTLREHTVFLCFHPHSTEQAFQQRIPCCVGCQWHRIPLDLGSELVELCWHPPVPYWRSMSDRGVPHLRLQFSKCLVRGQFYGGTLPSRGIPLTPPPSLHPSSGSASSHFPSCLLVGHVLLCAVDFENHLLPGNKNLLTFPPTPQIAHYSRKRWHIDYIHHSVSKHRFFECKDRVRHISSGQQREPIEYTFGEKKTGDGGAW